MLQDNLDQISVGIRRNIVQHRAGETISQQVGSHSDVS